MGSPSSLAGFAAPVQAWFRATFGEPTAAQRNAWPRIVAGENTLLVAPTGSGKTLAAFLVALDRLMFSTVPRPRRLSTGGAGTRILYISPIKALAVDVERNLLAPLAEIAATADAMGQAALPVTVAVRTGDTTAKLRRTIARGGADILITTPESLYLMLTSNARTALTTVDTVIIDEIHALVPTERGAHLMLSLERLEHLTGRPLQRIGLSATQRPLEEVARFLGGTRPVAIADAQAAKSLQLHIEMPFAAPAAVEPKGTTPSAPSNWDHIYPRLLELIDGHRSTLVFVNSRRLAERMAQALNALAQRTVVYAHHGSVAKDTRADIENQLKAGTLKGLIATNTLELGIDMGAIDLVVQVEAAPSVASGLQRIGRAGHQVGATSHGIVMPKFRGDIIACATLVQAMRNGDIEAIRYLRNPLDVLAQQLVAMVAIEPWHVDDLYRAVTASAPFAELPRSHFDATIDMLTGFYAIEELADARPRMTLDRTTGMLHARDGAKRVAIANAGTIPDRGLYAVYLANAAAGKGRIGELDEEMVFESKVGDRFMLGASTWRIEEITFDRVIVTPAPGEPGRMPFWRGENAMRPIEFGQRMGATLGLIDGLATDAALTYARTTLRLDATAATTLVEYLDEQRQKSAIPTDRRIVVETSRDEFGDWRVCVLSPLGAKVLAPWVMVVQAQAAEVLGVALDVLWTNDGFVVRVPDNTPGFDPLRIPAWLVPSSTTVTAQLTALLSDSALFAARFREAAARALLLPRKLPGQRTPLWQMRKKAQDLLRGAQRLIDFPILVETYRKCLTDLFDTAALEQLLAAITVGTIGLELRNVATPSPFANSLLFGYVAAFMYEGDVPPAERRAQTLAIDPLRLRELMGELALRDMLTLDVIAEVEQQLQHHAWPPQTLDAAHDLLLRLGDQTESELAGRGASVPTLAAALVAAGRAHSFACGAARLVVPIEYATRYHAAIGAPLPVNAAVLPASHTASHDWLMRYAKTHGPFTAADVAARYGVALATVARELDALTQAGELINGEFRPGGNALEWIAPDVLRTLRVRSLAVARKQVAAVAPTAFVRFTHAWQGVATPRAGLDALLDAIEKLQGLPVLASQLESDILPARVDGYEPTDLDTLAAAGEIVWHGVGASGERDGKIALYLADHASRFMDPSAWAAAHRDCDGTQRQIVELLQHRGALFTSQLRDSLKIFPGEITKALWALTWRGLVSNDSFAPLRGLLQRNATATTRGRRSLRSGFRSRRAAPIQSEGRWKLTPAPQAATPTERADATARLWLTRYGLVSKEVAALENVPGGFASLYPVFRALEDSGQIRRGNFVQAIAAIQFAAPHALDQLRLHINDPEQPALLALAANDCANPYGITLPWPNVREPDEATDITHDEDRPRRSVGAVCITINGRAAAWLSRGLAALIVWPAPAPQTERDDALLAGEIVRLAQAQRLRGAACSIVTINGLPASNAPFSAALCTAGFAESGGQLQLSRLLRG